MSGAAVLWFTGLSGAGKTTIAHRLGEILEQRKCKIKILDGDVVRKELHTHLGFTAEDIKENNRLIAQLCVNHAPYYDYLIVPIISPFRESRASARKLIGKNFWEVYVKVSLDQVIRRDSKGLYQKALKGEIENFIGIDPRVPYEEPLTPDITLDTEKQTADQLVETVLRKLLEQCKV